MTVREEQQAKRIKDLLARIEVLEAQIADLKAADRCDLPEALASDLTRIEAIIVRLLIRRSMVSKDAIMAAVYEYDAAPDPTVIESYVSRLRRKLKPYGVEIRCTRFAGYYIEPSERANLRQICRQEHAA